MSAIHEHPSYAGRIGVPPSPQCTAPLVESMPNAMIRALATAGRSCCCIARPAVIAFIPTPGHQSKQTDLLLCMHHYRAARQKLASSGARVIDASGALVTDPDPWYSPVRDG